MSRVAWRRRDSATDDVDEMEGTSDPQDSESEQQRINT